MVNRETPESMLDDLLSCDVDALLCEDTAVIDRRDSDELVDEAEKRGDIARRKAESSRVAFHRQKCAQIAAFADIGLPEPGEMITAITTGSFNAYTIVLHAIAQFNSLQSLALASFNMHQDVIADLFDQFDSGHIERLDVMLSESVKFRMPKRFDQMIACHEERAHTGRVRVKFNWNHSKIILFEAAGNRYCITGSGNLSDNAQFEQYHLSCNLDEFDFFTDWLNREYAGTNRKRELIL